MSQYGDEGSWDAFDYITAGGKVDSGIGDSLIVVRSSGGVAHGNRGGGMAPECLFARMSAAFTQQRRQRWW